MLFSKKIKSFYNTESGRSMIEMLGVLAIIGVLSIAGIAGYEFAVLKFRANEIINELNGRAISISSLLLNDKHTYVPEDVIEDGFGDTLSIGYSVESGISERNSNYFEISVLNVPGDVCVQILKSYENPIMIFVNGVDYNNDTSICQSESGSVEMDFVYRNDLGEHDKCSDRGYFGVDDFQCHCSGNTYIDPDNPLECLCPAGHIWSEAENTCIESICPEGYFESLSNGCVPCDDKKSYQIKTGDTDRISICEACSNRKYLAGYGWCVNMDSCPLGTGYWTAGPSTSCYKCGRINIPDSAIGQTGCLACDNMYLNQGTRYTHCLPHKECDSGYFLNVTGECTPCNTTDMVEIGRNEKHHALCRSCGNRSVKDNIWCIKTSCESTEFMGSDGKCYSCTHEASVKVNDNSGCTSTTCNREIVNGRCQLKTCDTTNGAFVRLSDGSCHDCSAKLPFKVSDESECDACVPSRRLVVASGQNLCMLESLCERGKTYPEHYGKTCNVCTSRALACDTGEFGKEYCEACGNHHLSQNFCVREDACSEGTEFYQPDWSYTLCRSCDISEALDIGTHEFERQMCLKCNAPHTRFWNGTYCYPCTTNSVLSISNEDEKNSCLSCQERTINTEGKCVLIQ